MQQNVQTYKQHRNCASGYLKPMVMLKAVQQACLTWSVWMLQCSKHTGLAHAPCILQDMYTEEKGERQDEVNRSWSVSSTHE